MQRDNKTKILKRTGKNSAVTKKGTVKARGSPTRRSDRILEKGGVGTSSARPATSKKNPFGAQTDKFSRFEEDENVVIMAEMERDDEEILELFDVREGEARRTADNAMPSERQLKQLMNHLGAIHQGMNASMIEQDRAANPPPLDSQARARASSPMSKKPIFRLLGESDEDDDRPKGLKKGPKVKWNDNLLGSDEEFETGSERTDGEVHKDAAVTTYTQGYDVRPPDVRPKTKVQRLKKRAETDGATTEEDTRKKNPATTTSTPKVIKQKKKSDQTTAKSSDEETTKKKKVRVTSAPTPLTSENAVFFKKLLEDMIAESGNSNTGSSEKAATSTTKTAKTQGKKEPSRSTKDVRPKVTKKKKKRVEVSSSSSPSSSSSSSSDEDSSSAMSSEPEEEEEEDEQENREYRKKRKEVHLKAPKIPEFNGDDYDGFMYKFENMRKQYKWQDSTSVFNMTQALTGKATKVLTQQKKWSYKELKKALVIRHGVNKSTTMALNEIFSIRRTPSESVQELADRIVGVALRAPMDTDRRSQATRTAFVQALEGNPKLQHYIEKHDRGKTTIQSAVSIAYRYERENGMSTETSRFDAFNARPQHNKPPALAHDKSAGGTAAAATPPGPIDAFHILKDLQSKFAHLVTDFTELKTTVVTEQEAKNKRWEESKRRKRNLRFNNLDGKKKSDAAPANNEKKAE